MVMYNQHYILVSSEQYETQEVGSPKLILLIVLSLERESTQSIDLS